MMEKVLARHDEPIASPSPIGSNIGGSPPDHWDAEKSGPAH